MNFQTQTVTMQEIEQLLKQGGQPVIFFVNGDSSALLQPTLATNIQATTGYEAATAITNDNKSYEMMLSNYLHQLGIPAHIKGYEYIKKAIELAMQNASILRSMTKELYPDIAKCYGTTPSRVERAIRHAIETAWNRGSIELQDDLFGTTISNMKGKPTNGEFIAMIAEKFRLQTVA